MSLRRAQAGAALPHRTLHPEVPRRARPRRIVASLAAGCARQIEAIAQDYAALEIARWDARPAAPRWAPPVTADRARSTLEALVARGHDRDLVAGAWAQIVERGERLFRRALADRKSPRAAVPAPNEEEAS